VSWHSSHDCWSGNLNTTSGRSWSLLFDVLMVSNSFIVIALKHHISF
jgi:hypothetical protein